MGSRKHDNFDSFYTVCIRRKKHIDKGVRIYTYDNYRIVDSINLSNVLLIGVVLKVFFGYFNYGY